MYRFRLTLLLLCGALLFPTAANSAPFTPHLNRLFKVAKHYWGGPPANCTSIERRIVPDDFLPDEKIAAATMPSGPEPCILWISRSLAPPRLIGVACAVMIHEVGHLGGRPHSLNPKSVMYPRFTRLPRICARLSDRFGRGLIRSLNSNDR